MKFIEARLGLHMFSQINTPGVGLDLRLPAGLHGIFPHLAPEVEAGWEKDCGGVKDVRGVRDMVEGGLGEWVLEDSLINI